MTVPEKKIWLTEKNIPKSNLNKPPKSGENVAIKFNSTCWKYYTNGPVIGSDVVESSNTEWTDFKFKSG